MPGAPAADAAYPNLADVPPRPTPSLSQARRKDEIRRLKEENIEGQASIKTLSASSSEKSGNEK